MTTETQRPSIRERIRAIDAGEPVISPHFLKDEAALLLASGEVVLAGASDRRISLHEGGILDSASTVPCCHRRRRRPGGRSGRQG